MEWSELKKLLDKLEDTRKPALITDAIVESREDERYIGSLGDYIAMVVLKTHGMKPDLKVVVPTTSRIPLAPLLEEGWVYGSRGAFDHRDAELAQKMLDFCNPYSLKRDKYLDEMSPGQRTMIEMISEDVSRYKRNEKLPRVLADTIEDALDSRIKAVVRETGKDTTNR